MEDDGHAQRATLRRRNSRAPHLAGRPTLRSSCRAGVWLPGAEAPRPAVPDGVAPLALPCYTSAQAARRAAVRRVKPARSLAKER